MPTEPAVSEPTLTEPTRTSVPTEGFRAGAGTAVGFSVLSSVCAVGLLALSGWLITRASEHPPVLYLLVAVVGVRALGLFRGVFRYLERIAGHRVALNRQAALRLRAWSALIERTWIGRRSGDLLARMVNDTAAAPERAVRVVVPIAGGLITAGAAVIMMGWIAPLAGLAMAGSAVLSGLLLPWIAGRLTGPLERAARESRGRLAALAAETSDASAELLTYGATDRTVNRSVELHRSLDRIEGRSTLIMGAVAAGQLISTGAAMVAGLFVGAHELELGQGHLVPALLAVLVLTPLALHEILVGLPAAWQASRRTGAALDRVEQIIASDDATDLSLTSQVSGSAGGANPSSAQGDGVVVVEGLTAGWAGRPVVRDVSFAVGPGERIGISGPSGSGKSTVAATVLGLIPPLDGRLSVTGRVGYLAQDAHLFDTTVAENLRIGRRDATDEEIVQVLHRVGLNLDPAQLVGEFGTRVSGGEARRIALARLLIRDDPVMIMDEPTEHLDQPTARALIETLASISADRAVIMISHDPDLLDGCDRVIDLTQHHVDHPPTAVTEIRRVPGPASRHG